LSEAEKNSAPHRDGNADHANDRHALPGWILEPAIAVRKKEEKKCKAHHSQPDVHFYEEAAVKFKAPFFRFSSLSTYRDPAIGASLSELRLVAGAMPPKRTIVHR
jgi:hypothetical protein